MKQHQRLAISQGIYSQSNQPTERRAQIVSIDLWQYKMNKGNQAFYENNPVFALRYFKQAVEVADNLLLLSFQQGSDPTAALQAMGQSQRNLTELFVRYEIMEEAINIRETFFNQLIEFLTWKNGNIPFRATFLSAMESELEMLLTLYYTMDVDQDKITSAISTAQHLRTAHPTTH